MKKLFIMLPAALGLLVFVCGRASAAEPGTTENPLPEWALGGFVRPAGANPVIRPDSQIRFFCPMRRDSVGWMESDTFNPAATVCDGEISSAPRTIRRPASANARRGSGWPGARTA